MNNEHKAALVTLAKVRQGALLLSLGNAYLCEPPILRKIGYQMARAIQPLPDQIKSLKSQFPGKFEKEVDTDSLVDDLNRRIQLLGDAEAEIRLKCSKGDLGRELELGVRNLAVAVNSVALQVEGKSSAIPVVRNGNLIARPSRKFISISSLLIVIAAILFGYLFATMERDEKVRNRLATLEAQAHLSRSIRKEIEREKDQLSRRMDSMKSRKLLKAEKIELINLGQDLHGVEERWVKVEAEIEKCEEEMESLQARLEKIKRKSFLQRLLRL